MHRLITGCTAVLVTVLALLAPVAPAVAHNPVVTLTSSSGFQVFLADVDDPNFNDLEAQLIREAQAVVARAPAGCADYFDKPSHLFDGSRSTFVRANIAYRKCLPSYDNTTYAFIKVNFVVGAYNVEGGSMTCNTLTRYLNGVTFDMRFWQPYRGTEFDPGGWSVACNETTTAGHVQNYTWDEQPRLYYGPGSGSDRQPMWKAYFKVNRRADTDQTWSKSQDFNPYS